MHAGGESYQYISALNAQPAHIDVLAALITKNLQGWSLDNNTQRAALAKAQGAQL